MCGIYGKILFDSDESINKQEFVRALNTLIHRGPDDVGVWCTDNIALGMRRLSIQDIENGQQPLWNQAKSLCIVYNGELYNVVSLRSELQSKGYVFRTNSDTEVVLYAYEEWGASCLFRLNGMFAFAIWSRKSQTLFIARDRIGEKPLYYFHNPDSFVFASEIKAIVADKSIARDINVRGFANYLAYGHALAPDTMYKGIHKLLPGHYLILKNKSANITQYWNVGDTPQVSERNTLSEEVYAERILALLEDSVRMRLIADVPVGAFLSGGVDSSAIVSLMMRHASYQVQTFSLGFKDSKQHNELSAAKDTADRLGTKHHEFVIDHRDMIDSIESLVHHYDEPFADAASLPLYVLSRQARNHVKVVLTGDGGDELFGGYRRYAYDKYARYYQKLPSSIATKSIPYITSLLPRLRRVKKAIATWQISNPAVRYAHWLYLFTPDMQRELLSADILKELGGYNTTSPYENYYHQLPNDYTDDLNRKMYVDVKTILSDGYMEKNDKATMANSLEARMPILDYRLVSLAFQIPGHMKVKGITKLKSILKKSVRDVVPSPVLKRPKHGFSVPTDQWFRKELRDFSFEILLDPQTKKRNLFDYSVIERMWKEHVNGKNVWNSALWLLLNFELWNRQYIDTSNP